MNNNIRIFYRVAKKFDFPLHYYPEIDVLEIHLANKYYYFLRSRTFLNEGGAVYLAGNKYKANRILRKAGFSAPRATYFHKSDYETKSLNELIKDMHFPLVAKPLSGTGRGTAVFSKVKDIETLDLYLKSFFKMHDSAEIEEFQGNLNEYRILVLKNKILGVLARTGAFVLGDGKHTIEELIDLKNVRRKELMKTLTTSPLVYDEEYQHCLEEAGLSLLDIPAKNQKVRLSYTANTGRGGDINPLSKRINRENAKTLIAATKALGLEYGGIDLLCEDLNRPLKEQKWFIIEINSCPDISLHEIPDKGKKTPVARSIFWELIKRHPFSYLKHRLKTGNLAFFIKIILCIIFLLFIIYSIE